MILPSIFLLIILTLCYYTSMAINGSIQAIAADRLGDSTAKDLGYATPNPLMYFEPINFVLFVLLGFFICPVLPINPFNIKSPFRYFKIFIIYFLEMVSSIFLSVISLLACVAYFGRDKTNILIDFFKSYQQYGLFGKHLEYFDFSSFSNVIGLILVSTVFINAIMAVTVLIFNFFKYLLIVGVEKNYNYIKYSDYFVFLIPFITLLLTFSFWYKYIFCLILKITGFAGKLLGIL
jgi:hypothetical protein